MADQTPGLKEAVRQIAVQREGHACEFHAKELCGMIVAHSRMQMLRNTPVPGMSEEVIAQRKALLDIPIKLMTQEIHAYMRKWFLPALEAWEKEFPI